MQVIRGTLKHPEGAASLEVAEKLLACHALLVSEGEVGDGGGLRGVLGLLPASQAQGRKSDCSADSKAEAACCANEEGPARGASKVRPGVQLGV